MLISYQDLTTEALFALAKEWVISNMSDTEDSPKTEEWAEKTVTKIKRGELLIEFGEENQTVYLKSPEELQFTANQD